MQGPAFADYGRSSLCHVPIKGTVARDFWPLVFFMNQLHMGP
jgi:hypothetical protein